MKTNDSNRIVVGLILVASIFSMDLVFAWGVFAYALAAIFIFTTPGKFVPGLILGVVTSIFIITGYFFPSFAADQSTPEIAYRVLLLFSIGLSVLARIRRNAGDIVVSQNFELDSAIAEKDEALYKLSQLSKEIENSRLEKKQIENELLKGRRLHEAMAHHFPDGVIGVLNSDLQYVVADGQGMEEFGVNVKDVRGEHLAVSSRPELKKAFAGDHVSFEMTIAHDVYTVSAIPIPDSHNEINEILIVIQKYH